MTVPCALCGGTDYSQPRPPFRHGGWTEVRGQRYHFDCEAEAAKQGRFTAPGRTKTASKPRVSSKPHPRAR